MDGAALREHRKRAGLSQADLAARLGLSRDFIGLMERGKAPVAPRTAIAVEQLAGRPQEPATEIRLTTHDPLERMVEEALQRAGIRYVTDHGGANASRLDFHLPDHGVDIEVKRFHTDRIAEQMARAPNVIALQGLEAVRFFCAAVEKGMLS
jgi:transcriptional regulator with XRE-family HTH domain